MGKQNKMKTSKTARDGFLAEREPLKRTERSKARSETYDDEVVDDKLTRKILDQARRQQEELQEEHGVKSEVKKTVRLGEGGSDSEAEGDDEALGGAEAAYYEDVEKVSEEDERALEQFMSKEAPARRTLADIIQEKLTEKKTEIHTLMSDDASVNVEEMDERVVKMYRQIRDILAKYRSGKLPKAFKIIPGLANWEQILYLTEPDRWSAAAMYQATRIFSSNLNAKMAQRFYNLVLYPRIRDDISEYKRLNFHLYMALKKSLFKPAAFFKGILLPLCESGTCTLREAVIVSSVIAKNSIPLLQSSAALLKMAEMPYSGAASIFLKTLLDKKYALPYRVIDAVVFHFLQFKTDKRTLPVLWHQCLLCFVQRYKNDMSPEQKEALLELLRIHVHDSMTPEIRREISKS